MKKPKLNKLEAAQLVECINSGQNVKVNRAPKSTQKGYTDTPLFLSVEQEKQQKLF